MFSEKDRVWRLDDGEEYQSYSLAEIYVPGRTQGGIVVVGTKAVHGLLVLVALVGSDGHTYVMQGLGLEKHKAVDHFPGRCPKCVNGKGPIENLKPYFPW